MSALKKIKLGIRSKIYVASLVIVLMLLLSGVMAFFEFGRMSYIKQHNDGGLDPEPFEYL